MFHGDGMQFREPAPELGVWLTRALRRWKATTARRRRAMRGGQDDRRGGTQRGSAPNVVMREFAPPNARLGCPTRSRPQGPAPQPFRIQHE